LRVVHYIFSVKFELYCKDFLTHLGHPVGPLIPSM
jgi:hypothetical protein